LQSTEGGGGEDIGLGVDMSAEEIGFEGGDLGEGGSKESSNGSKGFGVV